MTKILSLKGITVKFPGVTALANLDMDIRKGEVHVLIGENGAGKSSLIKVLCGIYTHQEGTMEFEGREYRPKSPHDAIQAGIRVVHQELNLLPYLSIAENIYFERLPRKNGFVDFKKLYKDTEELLKIVGLDASPKTKVELLGVAKMQLIEIAKALSTDSKVLLLDEPTASLTNTDIELLFKTIRRLKKNGITIIYISHRLKELFEIGDRITVLKNGEKVGDKLIGDVDIPRLVQMMVGKSMAEEFLFREDVKVGEELLRVVDLKRRDSKYTNSFNVKRGEIVGVSGLVGSGRTENMRAIFGADKKESGEIYLEGNKLRIRSPKDAVKAGISLITEDRKSQGLVLEMPCKVNMTLTDPKKISTRGFLQKHKEDIMAQQLVDDLAVKTPNLNQLVRNFSGGNQQKVVIAKWLFCGGKVCIFDEPTRGIDVGAKYEIYQLMWKLAEEGQGLIMISSDMPELLGLCHRILVFSDGEIVGEVQRKDFDQEEILKLAFTNYVNG